MLYEVITPYFVDAYYGPEEWKPTAEMISDTFPSAILMGKAKNLVSQLENINQRGLNELEGVITSYSIHYTKLYERWLCYDQ